jgi:hypothetical protein
MTNWEVASTDTGDHLISCVFIPARCCCVVLHRGTLWQGCVSLSLASAFDL